MSLNLLEPILEDSQIEEHQDDDVLHGFCGRCYPRGGGGREFSHCGKDITEEEQWHSWNASDECAMCVFMLQSRDWKCVNGHVQRGKYVH